MNLLQGLLAVWFLLLVAAVAFLASTNLRINLTGSLPLGFYRIAPGVIKRGTLVSACPDLNNPVIQVACERGYLLPGWLTCKGGVARSIRLTQIYP